MIATTVSRPTENLAVGRVGSTARTLPSIADAFACLAACEARGDLCGARLCRLLLQRVARDGRVGE
ncbi:hypothetical protein AQF52_4410 [Streptomyces venezuelae]|uniref:hypothetical protein n=1 Tax=Streptomyces gardneri TaxID=66892 RepID=UPI0006E3D2C3|nr:hypothetical protein [Streptomyces gardneri]ALO10004.1 hypothetical protein AQF52_4410 [Streptomyces venezuelae]QPK47043.1 hypothetical protein H4W23_22125 [Streptomyces gardneri]WRK38460.1 hypothetical protein U0M97_22225 [Streptomyces venezuelae]